MHAAWLDLRMCSAALEVRSTCAVTAAVILLLEEEEVGFCTSALRALLSRWSAADLLQSCMAAYQHQCRVLDAFGGSLYSDKQTMGCSTNPMSVTWVQRL
jgi:hypothetical protein